MFYEYYTFLIYCRINALSLQVSVSHLCFNIWNTWWAIEYRLSNVRSWEDIVDHFWFFCAKNSALWSDRYGCILIHCSYFEIEDSNRLCFIHLINIFCTASLSLSEGHNTMQALLRKIRQILRDRRTRRFFTRFVASVAAIVVFVTTYALILRKRLIVGRFDKSNRL